MLKAQKQIKTDGSTIITNRNLFTEKPSIKDLKDLINAHIHIESCRLVETKYRNTYLLTGPQITFENSMTFQKLNKLTFHIQIKNSLTHFVPCWIIAMYQVDIFLYTKIEKLS